MKQAIMMMVIASMGMVSLGSNVFASVNNSKIDQSNINQIIVFSDSFSDNGNLYYLLKNDTNGLTTIPQKPYYQGRFTNGLVWPEYFRDKNKVDLLNFSVAGARVFKDNGDLPISIPDLGEQVNQYLDNLKSSGAVVNQQALIAISIGSNDYAPIVHKCDGSTSTSQMLNEISHKTQEVMNSIQLTTQLLVEKGAKHFIFFNIPSLERAPRVNPNSNVANEYESNCRDLVEIAAYITKDYNDALSEMISKMNADFVFSGVNVRITLLDLEQLLNELLFSISQRDKSILALFDVEPGDVDQIDTVNACYTGTWFGYKKNPFLQPCSDAQHYLYYDNVHPTTHIHEYLSDKLSSYLLEEGYVLNSHLDGMQKK